MYCFGVCDVCPSAGWSYVDRIVGPRRLRRYFRYDRGVRHAHDHDHDGVPQRDGAIQFLDRAYLGCSRMTKRVARKVRHRMPTP